MTHHLPAQSSAWQSPRLSGEILHISNWSKLAAKSLQNIALYFALMVRFTCVRYFASHDLREPPLYLSCQPIRHPPLSVIVKVETHPLFFLVRQVWIHIFIERIAFSLDAEMPSHLVRYETPFPCPVFPSATPLLPISPRVPHLNDQIFNQVSDFK